MILMYSLYSFCLKMMSVVMSAVTMVGMMELMLVVAMVGKMVD